MKVLDESHPTAFKEKTGMIHFLTAVFMLVQLVYAIYLLFYYEPYSTLFESANLIGRDLNEYILIWFLLNLIVVLSVKGLRTKWFNYVLLVLSFFLIWYCWYPVFI